MPTDEEYKKAAEFLVEKMQREGCGIMSTATGYLLMFKRAYIQAYLDANPDNDEFAILGKKPDQN